MPVKQDDGTTKLVSKYYKSEAEAKAAMEKIRKKNLKHKRFLTKRNSQKLKNFLNKVKLNKKLLIK